MSQLHAEALTLGAAIEARRTKVVVVGQGVIGVPEAIAIARAGFSVVGLDRDAERVSRLEAWESGSPDVTDEDLRQVLASGAYRVTADPSALDTAEVVVICVPTPLTAEREPDLSMVDAAAHAIGVAADRPRLIILASTVPPGTTRGVVLPRLVAEDRALGRDVFLAFAPERLDPGNQRYTLATTPRLVSGVTEECRWLAEVFYRGIVESVKLVDSPEIAELAKAVENSFRFLNISFANEVAQLCDRLGYSVWEVVDAAATKPFAFMPHYPGPGVGGSCIPVVPHYLRHAAEQVGLRSRLIETSLEINDAMPRFVVDKLARLLNERDVHLAGARILVLGVTYKPNVADIRQSPALPILRLLGEANAVISYSDPYVSTLKVGQATFGSETLSPEVVSAADAVLVLTLHDAVDRELIVEHARLIFDTRNALKVTRKSSIVVL